jgi:hypothetical protein
MPNMPDLPESAEVNLKVVIGVAIAILFAVAGASTIAWIAWTRWSPNSDGADGAFDFKVQQAVLDSAPQDTKAEYLREKERLLNSYQWIDRQTGVARIPIERAMQIMAQRGAKAAPEAQP